MDIFALYIFLFDVEKKSKTITVPSHEPVKSKIKNKRKNI